MIFGKARRAFEKSCLETPSETTGGVDDPCAGDVAGADCGAGLDGGFCCGLCAKAGESGPPTSKPARIAAINDLAQSDAAFLERTPRTDRCRVLFSFLIIMITLEIL